MLLQLRLNYLILFVEETLISLGMQFFMKAKHAFLLVATLKIEHFGGILIEENATIHLINGHLLFFDLLPPDREIILLFEDGKVRSSLNVRMFPERYEAICRMFIILFLFECGLIEKPTQLRYLCINMKF